MVFCLTPNLLVNFKGARIWILKTLKMRKFFNCLAAILCVLHHIMLLLVYGVTQQYWISRKVWIVSDLVISKICNLRSIAMEVLKNCFSCKMFIFEVTLYEKLGVALQSSLFWKWEKMSYREIDLFPKWVLENV